MDDILEVLDRLQGRGKYLPITADQRTIDDLQRARDEIVALRAALLNVRSETLEEAARLYESINPASDEERLHGAPGAGAMGAVLEYRDAIRAMKAAAEVHEWIARAALGKEP